MRLPPLAIFREFVLRKTSRLHMHKICVNSDTVYMLQVQSRINANSDRNSPISLSLSFSFRVEPASSRRFDIMAELSDASRS